MAKEPIRIQTAASLEDAANVFQKSMRATWFSENISGQGTEFQTPPAGAFDSARTDPPKFSVMALLGGTGPEALKSAVYMYAWDRGEHREITMTVGRAMGAFGVKANVKMRKFVTALRAIAEASTAANAGADCSTVATAANSARSMSTSTASDDALAGKAGCARLVTTRCQISSARYSTITGPSA
jgi:hypothetical protein